MKYTSAELGRTFILRLEDGDRIPDAIERLAGKENIKSAVVFFIGGADKDSKVIVGPETSAGDKPVPGITGLPDISEALGVGTIFNNEDGNPRLHLHSAFGHGEETITGCTREGVSVWQIGEVIVLELKNNTAGRKIDNETGFELLEV